MANRLNVQDAIYWFEANRAMLDNAAILTPVHQLGEEAKASWRHDNAIKVQMYTTALAALRRMQEEEIQAVQQYQHQKGKRDEKR